MNHLVRFEIVQQTAHKWHPSNQVQPANICMFVGELVFVKRVKRGSGASVQKHPVDMCRERRPDRVICADLGSDEIHPRALQN